MITAGRRNALLFPIGLSILFFLMNIVGQNQLFPYPFLFYPISLILSYMIGRHYDKARELRMKLQKMELSNYENEQKYHSLFNEHPDGLFEIDTKGILTKGSVSLGAIFGFDSEELLGHHYTEYIYPDDLYKGISHVNEALNGNPQTYSLRLVHKLGHVLFTTITVVPYYINGTIMGVFGIMKDITREQLALEEIQKLKELLQETVREQQGMIFRFRKVGDQFIHTLCDGELLYKLGSTPENVIGKTLYDFIEEEAEQKLGYYERAWKGEEVQYESKNSHNNVIYFASLRPLYRNGEVYEVIGSAVDITERVIVERALRESEQKYRIIVENSSNVICILGADFNIVFASITHESMMGFQANELLGKSALKVVHPDDQEKAIQILNDCIEEKVTSHVKIRYLRKDGSYFWVDTTATAVFTDQSVSSIVVVARDISESMALEEKLTYMAYHDSLTGLANRRKFNEEFKKFVGKSKKIGKCALLYFDIDRFKVINDVLGHDAGDNLLQQISNRLLSLIHDNDLLARLGGDEFCLFVREADSFENIETQARNIISAFAEPFYLGKQEVYVTTSIGISIYPDDGNDEKTLLIKADRAMYHAKENGKNDYKFATPLGEQRYDKLELEVSLRRAIHSNEFYLEYQPKVSLCTNEVTGAECLIRWKHPKFGTISPQDFIPIAEDTGLIVPIGDWVIIEACRQVKKWKDKGRALPLSINLSLKQFLSGNLEKTLMHALHETGIPTSLIEFEITESILMKDLGFAIEILNSFKKKGIRISIDDFGTGYSSLNQLKNLPIDTLKIDRSFILNIPNDEDDKNITSSIVSMAKHLKLTVIAEGVETKDQLDFLRQQGCDEYQGYFFSRPISAEKMNEFLFHNN